MPDKESIFKISLSNQVGLLEKIVEQLTQKYKQLWLETASTFPEFPKTYSIKEKKRIEKETTQFLDELIANQTQHDLAELENSNFYKNREPEIERFCELASLYMDKQFTEGFNRSTKVFREKVKQFDSSLKPENIYQAMRNIWIMNSLQILMGEEIGCSNSMFAYSMLYPYSDNINDDVARTVVQKLNMNNNFRQWLEGKNPRYQNDNEQKIYLLVKMIEHQFPRSRFAGVFQSLLAIFNAQIKSLIQQKAHSVSNGAAILNISLEKGGTSVLADGYLITGNIDAKQQDFCFGYGAFLQFADDIQDVDDDSENGHITLFSQYAENNYLDEPANKLFNYMLAVVDSHLSASVYQRLRELILKNCCFMVQEAIGKNAQFYSREYIQRMEGHFPFSFSYFKKVKRRLKQILLQANRRN